MNTEFNKICMLDIIPFDFASFDKALLSEAEACRELVERGLRMNGRFLLSLLSGLAKVS